MTEATQRIRSRRGLKVLVFMFVAAWFAVIISWFAILFTGKNRRSPFDFGGHAPLVRARRRLRVPISYRPLPSIFA